MNFENEPPYCSSSSPPSSSYQSQCSPCTRPNPEHSPSASSSHARVHKRKAGRKKFRETRHPVYRGVRQRNGDRWVCEVREPNKKSRIWLGTYPTPEMAAKAHDAAVLALRGTSAMFNFPDSSSLLPVARSSSPADIREAASKAAEAFAPTNNMNPCSSSSSSANNLCVETNPCFVNDTCAKEEIGNDDDKSSESMFFDEEALFNMPGLLDSMAEGLLITPPSLKQASDWDDVEFETDLTLWSG